MYVVISVVGMSIAMGAGSLILSYANYELGFEHCHQNVTRVYRIGGNRTEGDRINYLTTVMFPLGPSLKEGIPGVEEQVRLRKLDDVTVRTDSRIEFKAPKVLLADASIFFVFSIPLIQGDSQSVLSRPASVVISERASKALFAGADPVGKTITIRDSIILTITGIMEDMPHNTQIHTDFIASLATLKSVGEDLNAWSDPGTFNAYTYVLLSKGTRPEAVDAELPGILASHLGETSQNFHLQTQSLENLYFSSNLSDELGPTGSLRDVYLLIGIGLLLVLMACFNYVNLSTARIFHRRRELLARSVAGATRGQLLVQFLAESIMLTSVSMAIGLMFYELSIPYLEAYVGRSLDVNLWNNHFVWLAAPVLVLIVGVVAGSYPAAVMVRQRPRGVLTLRSAPGPAKSRLRRTLVVFQAFIAIGLAGFTIGVQQQLSFIRDFHYGFEPRNVWLVEFGDDATRGQRDRLKRELESLGVNRPTLAVNAPGESIFRVTTARLAGQSENSFKVLNTFTGDENFTSTMDFQLVRGHWLFDPAVAEREDLALLNETAVEQLGLTDPIGVSLITSRGALTVVGVVKDFCALSLHNQVTPSIITKRSSDERILAMNLPEDIPAGMMSKMKNVWDGIFPNTTFQCRPLTDIMGESYSIERKFESLCWVSTALAVLIAILGMLGLTTFVVERRVREIGIRKSLGASLSSIVRLLTGELVLLVMVAALIAWPFTRYAITRWLESYAYRIDYGWITFLCVAAAVLMLVLLTTGIKVIKTANANPVDALRTE